MADKNISNKKTAPKAANDNRYRIPDVLDYKDTSSKKKQQRTAGKSRKRNDSMNGLILVLSVSVMAALILALVMIIQIFSNENRNQIPNETYPTVVFEANTTEHYISMNLESCTVLLGQSFQITVSAYPAELLESIVWTSNNEDVVYVDKAGNLSAVGPGIAAVTATSGDCADAIAIEVVESEYAETSLGLPMYAKVESVTQGGTLAPVAPSQGHPQGENQETEESQPSLEEIPDSTGDVQGGENQNEGGQPPAVPEIPSSSAAAETTANVTQTQEETTAFVPPTTEAPAAAIDTAAMFEVLAADGFAQYLGNASTYTENNIYMGEIIVDSDSVHIYIKSRSENFDKAVKNALAYLLPTKSESVWNAYLGASSDKTITADGRQVRIVMPAANAHAQIIVYNN